MHCSNLDNESRQLESALPLCNLVVEALIWMTILKIIKDLDINTRTHLNY